MCAFEVSVGKAQIQVPAKRKWRNGIKSVLGWVRQPDNQNLLAVACVGFFLGFWVIHRYGLSLPGIITRIAASDRHPAYLFAAEKRDRRIGEAIKLPHFFTLDGKEISLPEAQGLTALCFVGNCTACAARDSMLSTETLNRRFPYIKFYLVIMSGDRELAQALWRDRKLSVPVIMDLNGDAAVRLNAIYNGRYYLFDARSRLLYLSGRDYTPQQLEQDINRVAHLTHIGGER